MSNSFSSYAAGFLASLALTLAAYHVVTTHAFGAGTLLPLVAALVAAQLIVQLYFFFRFSSGESARWDSLAFSFMLVFVVIVVGGSVWIMANLNSRMMLTPAQMEQYMQNQDGM